MVDSFGWWAIGFISGAILMITPALFILRQEGKQRKTLYDCRFGSKMPPPPVKYQNNMGCDCCKIHAPQDYAKCKVANEVPHGKYIAPCGMSFDGSSGGRGSNYTPPKKRKKRKR